MNTEDIKSPLMFLNTIDPAVKIFSVTRINEGLPTEATEMNYWFDDDPKEPTGVHIRTILFKITREMHDKLVLSLSKTPDRKTQKTILKG